MNLLEPFGEFQTAMPRFDAGVKLPGQQVETRQETQSAMAFVFVVPASGWAWHEWVCVP